MADGYDWLVQGIAVNIVSDAAVLTSIWAWKNRDKIAAKLKQVPKPTVVPLEPLPITSTLGKASIKAGSSLTLKWNVEPPTPPLSTRLVDEAIELLSVLTRHL
jgi:hypothetical protein